MQKELSLKSLTIIGVLGALSAVLGMTPLGFIPLGPISITIMHIPVIIGAIYGGVTVGASVGLIFGIVSLIRAIIAPTVISPALYNPLISILPRVLIGVVTGYSYMAFQNSSSKILKYSIPAALGSLTNTIGFLSGLYFFYGRELANLLGGSSLVGKGVIGIGLSNGVPEMIVAAIITTATMSKIKNL
ncbi:MAG: ECF transporter S component [Andreesenia angusta]|nr:ECF transporter S component [Andreesenia angusta]